MERGDDKKIGENGLIDYFFLSSLVNMSVHTTEPTFNDPSTYVDIDTYGEPYVTTECYTDANTVLRFYKTHKEKTKKAAAAIVYTLLKEKKKLQRIGHQIIIVREIYNIIIDYLLVLHEYERFMLVVYFKLQELDYRIINSGASAVEKQEWKDDYKTCNEKFIKLLSNLNMKPWEPEQDPADQEIIYLI